MIRLASFVSPASLVALVTCFGAIGCSGAASNDVDSSDNALSTSATDNAVAPHAQMNDLSVLYPLATSSQEFATYLTGSSKGVGGTLLPAAMFEKATGLSARPPTKSGGIGSSPTMAYDQLRAIAFRLDPCFATIGPVTDPATCQNQLRIVYQAATYANGSTSMFDGAVHAFYSLTRAELTETISAIVALRIANGGTTDLGPLAVHPILAKQGLEGAMAEGLNAILAKHAGAANLTRFTVFQGSNLDTAWNFQAYDVTNGVAKPSAIAGMPSGTNSETFAEGFTADLGGSFAPAPTASDDLSLLTNVANTTAATPAQRQSAFDSALRIENPNFASPNTVDCASCHMAEPARVFVARPFDLTPSAAVYAYEADTKIVPAADMARTTTVDMKVGLNLHAFSYKDSTPAINQRVVNETASNVAYVNAVVLAGT